MNAPSPNATPPRLSLLVCTVGRTSELERLLASLTEQAFRHFEVIVVDQNEDDVLAPILDRFATTLDIIRIRSPRGLSRARNAGLAHCRGEIVAFPDDDCWYAPNLLVRVARAFEERADIGFLTGRWLDETGQEGHHGAHDGCVSVSDVWHRTISFTIFCRRAAMEHIGGFDERLGVGAGTPWGSGEETDYLLRLLESGVKGWHDSTCIVFHPRQVMTFDERAFRRALAYGRGMGFILRKHAAGWHRILRFLLRPLIGAGLAALTLRWRKAKYHLLVAKGRSCGLLACRAHFNAVGKP